MSIFLNQYHKELEDDILTHDDWQILKMTHEFLQPFYQATLEQQMEWASIDQVLENMDILFKQFEDAKLKYIDNRHMVNSIHMGWWVLSKYYRESDKNPIYGPVAAARQLWAKYKDRPLAPIPSTQPDDERREISPYERIKQSMSVLDEPGDEDEFEKFIKSP
ncbi:hypothetical protein BGZ61DRAFT_434950 [Ilyonectria robusta]|uniref:uncharacterized protein n=1 Tax=Ilyonectria robusta TaxID=1079257 RepID=UPI001E8DB042|nr:uncharacterized protein BGZ61DRAFT_434950 [Ilyonectria robusta]KAH8654706.1 hypothetical protein BGZ61DRAFT_434950 [Ilyonectria robusta]